MKYLFFALVFLMSCSSQKIDHYVNEEPKLELNRFFQGNLKALGIVQDRSGKVVNRFTAKIKASWDKNILTLDEDFKYSDKSTSKRIWKLESLGRNKYIGSAHDVAGKANGIVKGNTFFFEYTLKIPVNGSVYDIKIDDWLYLLDDKTMLGRSYMTKFGVNVGEITIIMIKE